MIYEKGSVNWRGRSRNQQKMMVDIVKEGVKILTKLDHFDPFTPNFQPLFVEFAPSTLLNPIHLVLKVQVLISMWFEMKLENTYAAWGDVRDYLWEWSCDDDRKIDHVMIEIIERRRNEDAQGKRWWLYTYLSGSI